MIYVANAFRKQESIPLLFDNEMYLKSAHRGQQGFVFLSIQYYATDESGDVRATA